MTNICGDFPNAMPWFCCAKSWKFFTPHFPQKMVARKAKKCGTGRGLQCYLRCGSLFGHGLCCRLRLRRNFCGAAEKSIVQLCGQRSTFEVKRDRHHSASTVLSPFQKYSDFFSIPLCQWKQRVRAAIKSNLFVRFWKRTSSFLQVRHRITVAKPLCGSGKTVSLREPTVNVCWPLRSSRVGHQTAGRVRTSKQFESSLGVTWEGISPFSNSTLLALIIARFEVYHSELYIDRSFVINYASSQINRITITKSIISEVTQITAQAKSAKCTFPAYSHVEMCAIVAIQQINLPLYTYRVLMQYW